MQEGGAVAEGGDRALEEARDAGGLATPESFVRIRVHLSFCLSLIPGPKIFSFVTFSFNTSETTHSPTHTSLRTVAPSEESACSV